METNVGEAVDGRLKALIATAEQDEKCPNIYVIVGSWVVQGRPVSTAEFMRTTYRDYVRQASKTPEGRKMKDGKEMGEHLRPLIGAFGYKSEADTLALSVADASVSGASGPILKVPALRIPIHAIQAWWSAEFEVHPNRGPGGGSISAGVIF